MGYIGQAPANKVVTSADIEDSAITSAKILDGTIANADVNDLAATKLSGTIADARFPATLPAASGANLTSLPAGNLTGTVADARISTLTSSKLSGALPAVDGSNLTGMSGFDVTSITGATALDAQPALTDELVMSDAGTLKRIDFSNLNQHKHFFYARSSDPQSVSWNNQTLINLNWEHDPENNFDISAGNHKFTAPEAGKYFFAWTLRITLGSGNAESMLHLYKNGSASGISTYDGGMSFKSANNINSNSLMTGHFIFNVAEDDYFQIKAYTYQYNATLDSTIGTNTCSLMGWQLD